MKEEIDGKVFISRQSPHLSFVNDTSKVLFPTCTLTGRVNNYVSLQAKGINGRNESANFIIICIVEGAF